MLILVYANSTFRHAITFLPLFAKYDDTVQNSLIMHTVVESTLMLFIVVQSKNMLLSMTVGAMEISAKMVVTSLAMITTIQVCHLARIKLPILDPSSNIIFACQQYFTINLLAPILLSYSTQGHI